MPRERCSQIGGQANLTKVSSVVKQHFVDNLAPNLDSRRGAAGRADSAETPKVMWKRDAHMQYVTNMKYDTGYKVGDSAGKDANESTTMQEDGSASQPQPAAFASRASSPPPPPAAPAEVGARAAGGAAVESVMQGHPPGGGGRSARELVGDERDGVRIVAGSAASEQAFYDSTRQRPSARPDSVSLTSGLDGGLDGVDMAGAGSDAIGNGSLDSDEERVLAEKFFQVRHARPRAVERCGAERGRKAAAKIKKRK